MMLSSQLILSTSRPKGMVLNPACALLGMLSGRAVDGGLITIYRRVQGCPPGLGSERVLQ